VDVDGDDRITLRELEEWYMRHQAASRKQREEAMKTRVGYRTARIKDNKNSSSTETSQNSGSSGSRSTSKITTGIEFEAKFYEVIPMDEKARKELFEADLLNCNLNGIACPKTEVPVIISILEQFYEVILELHLYYSSVRRLNEIPVIGILMIDQTKHMINAARLLIKTWEVEEEFLMLKKRIVLENGGNVKIGGMLRGKFMEFLVRLAAIHTRTIQTSKLSTPQWLLEICQKHLRDNAREPLQRVFSVRQQLVGESVQEVYTKYIDKLAKAYNRYAIGFGDEEPGIITQEPLNTNSCMQLFKTIFPKNEFKKRDFVHWYIMSRQDVASGNHLRSGGLINMGVIWWNEYLEMIARFAVFVYPKASVRGGLAKMLAGADWADIAE